MNTLRSVARAHGAQETPQQAAWSTPRRAHGVLRGERCCELVEFAVRAQEHHILWEQAARLEAAAATRSHDVRTLAGRLGGSATSEQERALTGGEQ